MPFARASSLDRLLNCYGDLVLGGTDEKSEYVKVAADWGTMAHEWKETGQVVVVNNRQNIAKLFEKKLREGRVNREQWWPKTMIHEVAMAVNPFQAYGEMREGDKAEKEAWKAAFGDDWCTGTLDGYDWMFDVLWIDDLKTGRFVEEANYIEQRRFYALGLCRLLDYRGPVNITLTHWPRYPVLSQPNRFGRVIEQDEIRDFEKRLVKLRDDVRRAKEKREHMRLVSGEHCTFCPSRKVCPELNQGETDYGQLDD